MKAEVSVAVMMKPLAESKSRLAPVLSPEGRALLSLSMLGRVLQAARRAAASVAVIGGDEPVRRLAAALGAGWRPELAAGLNEALAPVFASAAAEGRHATLYLPADLPLIEAADVHGLLLAAEGGRVVIAPDRHEAGTNALLVPAALALRPALGEGSFRRHVEQAQALGVPWQAYRSRGLALDVDTPADLDFLLTLWPDWWREAEAMVYARGLMGRRRPAARPL